MKIIRIYEGDDLPVGVRLLQMLAREDEPILGSTGTRRVYTLAVEPIAGRLNDDGPEDERLFR